MKKLNFMVVMLMIVIIVFTACSNHSKKVNSNAENSVSFLADENETVSFFASKTENHNSKIVTETESSTEISTTETTVAQSATKPKETEKTTTAKPDVKKSVSQSTTKKQSDTTVKKVNPQTTASRKSETTKAVVTTAKPSTTKKVTTTEKSFDIDYWVSYAKNYAKSVGLNLNSDAVDCWDNPINANSNCKYLERDIKDRLNRYAKNDDMTDVWIWAEQTDSNSYQIYIGYA